MIAGVRQFSQKPIQSKPRETKSLSISIIVEDAGSGRLTAILLLRFDYRRQKVIPKDLRLSHVRLAFGRLNQEEGSV